MIDFATVELKRIAIHKVGNKLQEEGLNISSEEFVMSDSTTRSFLLKYFLTSFNSKSEVYNFTHASELSLNEVFTFVSRIFDSPKTLYKNSVFAAKHLYEMSMHPKIKSGELCVCYFTECFFNDEQVDAVGIFKSEDKDVFLKFDEVKEGFSVKHENGANINKLDKGCIIFNIDKEEGYKVCIVDSNRGADAQYWKNDFLNVKPCADNYHFTKNFLSVTKEYVTNQLAEEFEVTKTDQIDILNRSMDYFKKNENFDKRKFEKEVLQDTGIIQSFRSFDERYSEENELQGADSFQIAPYAVQRQAKIYKSVLKLDKNFHIYIHGNKDMIEQGTEKDGRKYYKIYYKEES
jgi:hypothetical protein